jgi:HK97 gp10 family phage protein
MKLTGLARTQRRLARVYDVSRADLDWVLPEIGEIVRADAEAHLTPGHGYDTGKMAGSIAVGPVERQGLNRAYVKVGPTKEGWYGRFIEFGTRLLAAMPFLRPARDRNAGTYKTRLKASQAEALRKLAAEGDV